MKHLQRRFSTLVIVALSCLGLVSCIEAGRSPNIEIQDIRINGVSKPGAFTDTISVGDTLQLDLLMNGFNNLLVAYKVEFDRSTFKDSLISADRFDQYFTSNSRPETGYYEFKEGHYYLKTTWTLIPIKDTPGEAKAYDFKMAIQSNRKADDRYNPVWYGFKINCGDKNAPKPEEKE